MQNSEIKEVRLQTADQRLQTKNGNICPRIAQRSEAAIKNLKSFFVHPPSLGCGETGGMRLKNQEQLNQEQINVETQGLCLKNVRH